MIESDLDSGKRSKILVPLPPFIDIIQEVKERVSDIFSISAATQPTYLELPDFEGFLVDWKSWYAIDNYSSDYKLQVVNFKLWLENKIRNSYGLTEEEEIMIIEFYNDSDYKWIDLKDRINYNEIMTNRYILNEEAHIDIYHDFLRIFWLREGGSILKDVAISELETSEFQNINKKLFVNFKPIFIKLCQRGIIKL